MSVPREHAPALERPTRPCRRLPTAVSASVESLMLEERTRWAMTIHDGLTQSVTSAILELQSLRHRIEVDPAGAVEMLEEIEDAIRHDLSEIREVLFELDEGRCTTSPSFAAFVQDSSSAGSCRRASRSKARSTCVPEAVLDAAHGVVGEALTNAAKHSGSKDVAVRVGRRSGGASGRGRGPGPRHRDGHRRRPPLRAATASHPCTRDRRLDRDRVRPPDAAFV